MAENEERSDESPEEGPKTRKIWIILIAGLILTGGAGVVLWRLDFFPAPGSPASASAEPESERVKAQEKMSEVKSTMNLESFLVNLADKEDVRFIKAQFQLGLAEEDESLTKNPVILAATRDSIISLLSSKTSDQIMTPQGKEQLRHEIRDRVNAILPKGLVREVFIVDFVVQL